MKLKMPKDKFFGAVQVGDQGQFVIPKEVMEMFHIEPGDSLMVLADKNQGVVIRKKLL